MGFVWNIMLSFDNEELWPDGADQPTESCEPLDRINAWIPDGRLVSLVGPTYRDNAGNTWTGRGRMPRWMVAATKDGKAKKEDFLIA